MSDTEVVPPTDNTHSWGSSALRWLLGCFTTTRTSTITNGTVSASVADIVSAMTDARTPTSHASSHKNGGTDEVATDTPSANVIPKAGADGKVALGFLPTGTTEGTVALGPHTHSNYATTTQLFDTIDGLDWQENVISFYDPTSGLPSDPSAGDRYIADHTANGWTINNIYEYRSGAWVAIVPDAKTCVSVDSEDCDYVYNASLAQWMKKTSSGGGHTIQNAGTPLTDRANLNTPLAGGMKFEDDGGNDATTLSLNPAGLTEKETTIADGDAFVQADSAASNVPKKTLWSTIKAVLKTYFDSIYASISDARLTDARTPIINGLTEKTTALVDADQFAIADSAASNASKKSLWSTIKSTLKTYFDALYATIMGWVSISAFSTTAASTSTITLTSDIRAYVKVGHPIKFKLSGTYYYAICTAITDTLLTIAGAPLTTSAGALTELYYDPIRPAIKEDFFVGGYYADGTDTALLLHDNLNPYYYDYTAGYLVQSFFRHNTDAGTSQPDINVTIDSHNVLTENSGNGVAVSTTRTANSAVGIDTTYYAVTRGMNVGLAVTVASNPVLGASDLGATLIFVRA